MNYTIVLNGFVWVACMTYYFLFARKWYTGPKMTVDGVDSRVENDSSRPGSKDPPSA